MNFDILFVQRNDVSEDHLKDEIPEFCLVDNIQSYSAGFWSCISKRRDDNLTCRFKYMISAEVLPTNQFSSEIRIQIVEQRINSEV